MAERATHVAEELLAVAGTGRQWRRLRSIDEAHEHGEHEPGRHDLQWVVVQLGLGARNVERLVDHAAARLFAAAHGEEVVADAHFDVVGLAGEDGDRRVLRLPAEAADGAVVRDHVGMALDSQLPLELLVGAHVGADGGVLDRLDQAEAEQLQRNAEGDVAIADCLDEVRLRRAQSGASERPWSVKRL